MLTFFLYFDRSPLWVANFSTLSFLRMLGALQSLDELVYYGQFMYQFLMLQLLLSNNAIRNRIHFASKTCCDFSSKLREQYCGQILTSSNNKFARSLAVRHKWGSI